MQEDQIDFYNQMQKLNDDSASSEGQGDYLA
jgi:hypothetical protein